MEQGIGHKLKHVAYGVEPSPAVVIHFTCTTQTEAARVWPLRLYGFWHRAAVREAEVAAQAILDRSSDPTSSHELVADAPAPVASTQPPRRRRAVATSSAAGADGGNPRMIALVGGLFGTPLPPMPWASLNAARRVPLPLLMLGHRVAPKCDSPPARITDGRARLAERPRTRDAKPHLHGRAGARADGRHDRQGAPLRPLLLAPADSARRPLRDAHRLLHRAAARHSRRGSRPSRAHVPRAHRSTPCTSSTCRGRSRRARWRRSWRRRRARSASCLSRSLYRPPALRVPAHGVSHHGASC